MLTESGINGIRFFLSTRLTFGRFPPCLLLIQIRWMTGARCCCRRELIHKQIDFMLFMLLSMKLVNYDAFRWRMTLKGRVRDCFGVLQGFCIIQSKMSGFGDETLAIKLFRTLRRPTASGCQPKRLPHDEISSKGSHKFWYLRPPRAPLCFPFHRERAVAAH